MYNPLRKVNTNLIIPTENDTYFRHQVIQGYVHDMAAAMQGGISGHAGLFANALDVAKVMQMYLQKELMVEELIFLKTHLTRSIPVIFVKGNRRGVGF